MSVQIAIVGIVVVVGLFVLWRRIARLEERVEALSNMQRIMGGAGFMQADGMEGMEGMGGGGGQHENGQHSLMPDEDIMAAIFDLPLGRSRAGIVELSEGNGTGGGGTVTVVEEEDGAVEEADAAEEAEEAEEAIHDVAPSESEQAVSKSKLRKLTVDELKSMLEARGLSTDGSKVVLVERLHGE